MPVYLCLAGAEADEPWKHGIQVFAKPFAVPEQPPVVTTLTTTPLPLDRTVGTSEPIHLVQQQHHGMIHQDLLAATATAAGNNSNHSIRKVMHAQVVLVDDVCMAYGRYWVRLRWPGSKGGFAGYIAMHQIPAQLTPDHDGLAASAAANDEKDHPNPPICKPFCHFFIISAAVAAFQDGELRNNISWFFFLRLRAVLYFVSFLGSRPGRRRPRNIGGGW
jgi:hypothetical protein